jgi:hypothetical protein
MTTLKKKLKNKGSLDRFLAEGAMVIQDNNPNPYKRNSVRFDFHHRGSNTGGSRVIDLLGWTLQPKAEQWRYEVALGLITRKKR